MYPMHLRKHQSSKDQTYSSNKMQEYRSPLIKVNCIQCTEIWCTCSIRYLPPLLYNSFRISIRLILNIFTANNTRTNVDIFNGIIQKIYPLGTKINCTKRHCHRSRKFIKLFSLLNICFLLLLLLLLLFSMCGIVNSQPNVDPFHHRNHSNIDEDVRTNHSHHHKLPQLPSSTTSTFKSSSTTIVTTNESSSTLANLTLSLEQLLQEQSLDIAIQKLTNAWNQAHLNTKPYRYLYDNDEPISSRMISSQQAMLDGKYEEEEEVNKKQQQQQKSPQQQDDEDVIHRHRRWVTKPITTTNDSNEEDIHLHEDIIDSSSQLYDSLQTTNGSQHFPLQSENIINGTSINQSTIVKNCTRCRPKEEARSLRLESIKYSILNKLGMERPPNISRKSLPNIPPIIRLLKQNPSATQKRFSDDFFGPLNQHDDADSDENDFYVNTEKSIIFAQSPPQDRLVLSKLRAQYFKFPINIINLQINRATLWLYLNGSNINKPETDGHVVLYQIVRGTTSLKIVHKRKVNNSLVRRGGWIKIELKNVVQRWFEAPETNLGLAIHSYDSDGNTLSVIHHEDVLFESPMRPFIEVRVSNPQTSESIRRKRMTTLNCEDKSPEVRCCRYPLTIDFESFGWEWVIAPKRYEANYCSGECGLLFMNSYPHTHLMQQANMYNPTGPCCSPRKMSPISMLYMDADYNIIYGILPNMVVDKCDCS